MLVATSGTLLWPRRDGDPRRARRVPRGVEARVPEGALRPPRGLRRARLARVSHQGLAQRWCERCFTTCSQGRRRPRNAGAVLRSSSTRSRGARADAARHRPPIASESRPEGARDQAREERAQVCAVLHVASMRYAPTGRARARPPSTSSTSISPAMTKASGVPGRTVDAVLNTSPRRCPASGSPDSKKARRWTLRLGLTRRPGALALGVHRRHPGLVVRARRRV